MVLWFAPVVDAPRWAGTQKEDTLKRIALLMLLGTMLAYGCSGNGNGQAKVDEKDVVARVGDKVITATQVDQFLKNLPPQVSGRYGPDRIRREIVDGFVSMELIANEARRRGIDKREDMKLKIEMLVDQALARELEQELRKDIKVDEAELKKYYEQNKDKYTAHTRMRASRITVPTEEQAKAVLARIKKGEDFSELAKKFSKDENALRGGSMGTVRQGKLPPELDKVLAGLKEGQVSQPVKTQQGYVILRVDKITEYPQRSYEEMKPRIERMVMREKISKVMNQIKEEAKKKTRVEINEGYFVKIGKPSGPGPEARPAPSAAEPGEDADE
jgi:peptidyl-prolyl cis-trans isomerase C